MATFFVTKWFKSVDLPTFGIPATNARIGLSLTPFSSRAAHLSANTLRAAFVIIWGVLWPRVSKATTSIPWASKYFFQAFVRSGSAKSVFVITNKRGFWPKTSSSSGLRDETGMRASTNSNTISTYFKFSRIRRKALAMWPGNHWIIWAIMFFLSVLYVWRY